MARRKSSNFISGAIKRPGALTKKKRRGESTAAAARRISSSPSSSALAKQQANFYQNVLAPSTRSGNRKSSSNLKRRSHTVKSHTRTLSSGKKVKVKRHRRSKAK